MPLFFSIIVPTYNRGYLLTNTIQSLLNQTYPHFEIIIVDDGSTDNTEDIVASIQSEKIKYYKISNSERGYARNFGAKHAKGDYLNFFDSDDIAYPNHLSTAKDFIEKHNPLIFALNYETIKDNKRVIKNYHSYPRKKKVNQLLIQGNLLSCSPVFIEKKTFLKYQFNEDRTIAGLEDWELWLRIASHHEIKHSHTITSASIQHENRSVLQTHKDQLIRRVETFMHYVLTNPSIRNYYSRQLHLFKCSCYTYIALHIALTKKDKIITLKYLLRGIAENPLFIFKRRFLAILKHLLL